VLSGIFDGVLLLGNVHRGSRLLMRADVNFCQGNDCDKSGGPGRRIPRVWSGLARAPPKKDAPSYGGRTGCRSSVALLCCNGGGTRPLRCSGRPSRKGSELLPSIVDHGRVVCRKVGTKDNGNASRARARRTANPNESLPSDLSRTIAKANE